MDSATIDRVPAIEARDVTLIASRRWDHGSKKPPGGMRSAFSAPAPPASSPPPSTDYPYADTIRRCTEMAIARKKSNAKEIANLLREMDRALLERTRRPPFPKRPGLK